MNKGSRDYTNQLLISATWLQLIIHQPRGVPPPLSPGDAEVPQLCCYPSLVLLTDGEGPPRALLRSSKQISSQMRALFQTVLLSSLRSPSSRHSQPLTPSTPMAAWPEQHGHHLAFHSTRLSRSVMGIKLLWSVSSPGLTAWLQGAEPGESIVGNEIVSRQEAEPEDGALQVPSFLSSSPPSILPAPTNSHKVINQCSINCFHTTEGGRGIFLHVHTWSARYRLKTKH